MKTRTLDLDTLNLAKGEHRNPDDSAIALFAQMIAGRN